MATIFRAMVCPSFRGAYACVAGGSLVRGKLLKNAYRAVRLVSGNAMAEVSVLRLFLIYDELHHITWLTSEIPT